MGAQHGKLDVEGRVEHHIGCFLERYNPLILGLAHAVPLTDSLTSREGSFVVVADNATQQTVVLCGNPVVIVERDAGKGRDVNLVLGRIGNLLSEQGIQGVDTLDNQHAIVAQLKLLAIPLALTSYKVILGHFYYLALHQAFQVLAQQLVIYGLDIIKVVLTVRQLGGIDTVHKIIVG